MVQVVNIFSFEHSHRDIFVTDFTGNEKVKDAPLSGQGAIDSPPTKPFGKYVAKVTLWKSHGLLPALNQLRPGSFIRLCNVTCKPTGSAWFFNIQESSPFMAVHILPSNSRALQPLLKSVFLRRGSSSPFTHLSMYYPSIRTQSPQGVLPDVRRASRPLPGT